MPTAVLTNGQATLISQANPSTNYDYQTGSIIRNGATSGFCQIEMYFARPFPLGATVTDAKLHFWSRSTAQTGSLSVGVRRIKTQSIFSRVTWNTRVTQYYATTSTTTKTGPLATDTEWVFDVTAQMQSISLGDPWYGFDIFSTTLNPGMYWFMPNHSSVDQRPWLEVTWSDAPATPRNLAPAGSRAISGTKPILRCDYVDVSGDVEMQAIQAQLSSTSSFNFPTFDTGVIASSTPEIDLNTVVSTRTVTATTTNGSTTVTGASGTFWAEDVGSTITGAGIPAGATITAFTFSTTVTISAAATASASVPATVTGGFSGLTDGQVVYWRARVQDAAGLWSDWADPVSFARDVKGTLTLNNPSSGTPIVQDSTPPIGWTFTGETQAAYQLILTETKTDGTTKTWTTGKITGTANEVTPPAGVITSPASTYTATLRIWDAKQRESIPNDPAYVEVFRDFTFVPSATVTATTALTAAGVYPYPRVALTWQRTTDPDTFSILRNNVVIASGLIPNDIRASGTTFAYTDRNAPPQTPLTYTVQAVVNKVASSGNATASTTLISQGIWLADANRTNEVWIFDRTEQTMVYGEQSTPIEVVGGTEIVLVTQSLRGLEGTIKGTLVDTTGIGITSTASAWRNKLLLIKAKAGQKCWLTMGDRNIQCVIRNLTVNPRPTSPLSFTVSFDFYQVGTLDYTPVL